MEGSVYSTPGEGYAFKALRLIYTRALGPEAPLPSGILLEDGTFSPGTNPGLIEMLRKGADEASRQPYG